MIFITIGTANKGFNRLIERCDIIAGKYNIEFFAQIGSSTYKPKYLEYCNWLDQNEMLNKYKLAKGYIVHGGFGTLSEVLSFKKPIIVVPRNFEDGEAVNDQNDICMKLDGLGYVKCLSHLDELEKSVNNLSSLKLKEYDLVSDIPYIIHQQINILRTNGNL